MFLFVLRYVVEQMLDPEGLDRNISSVTAGQCNAEWRSSMTEGFHSEKFRWTNRVSVMSVCLEADRSVVSYRGHEWLRASIGYFLFNSLTCCNPVLWFSPLPHIPMDVLDKLNMSVKLLQHAIQKAICSEMQVQLLKLVIVFLWLHSLHHDQLFTERKFPVIDVSCMSVVRVLKAAKSFQWLITTATFVLVFIQSCVCVCPSLLSWRWLCVIKNGKLGYLIKKP